MPKELTIEQQEQILAELRWYGKTIAGGGPMIGHGIVGRRAEKHWYEFTLPLLTQLEAVYRPGTEAVSRNLRYVDTDQNAGETNPCAEQRYRERMTDVRSRCPDCGHNCGGDEQGCDAVVNETPLTFCGCRCQFPPDAARSTLAQKVLTVVKAERLCDKPDNRGDAAYNQAIDDATSALRALFQKEGIELESE